MGEFNVNKTDGSLEQTAGMPSEYPATQVMMSDGVTSVEERLDGLTEDSGWKTTDDISYRKIGNFVTVHGEKNIGTTTQAWVVLGNLPEGYRPSFNIKNSAYTSNATAGIYTINKNGNVSVWGNSANIDMHLCFTFPLG